MGFRKFLFILIIACAEFFSLFSIAHAQSDLVPRPWPETFIPSPVRRTNKIGLMIVNMTFGAPAQTGLYGGELQKNISLQGEVDREVFDNYNLLKTWTVVDRLKIKLNFVPISLGSLNADGSYGFAGISLGARGVLEWRDIRQLTPGATKKLPPIKKQKALLGGEEEESDFKASAPEALTNTDDHEINPYLHTIPEQPARELHRDVFADLSVAHLLNPITLPFRMPLSRRDVRKMRVDEVISYNISGEGVFGLSVGYPFAVLSGISVGPSVNFETHFNGVFEVAVLKESDRYASVRVSRLNGKGHQYGAKIAVDGNQFYHSFLKIDLRIVPIEYLMVEEHSHEISSAYRYDLESVDGREAFHRAVLGQVAFSDDLARNELGHPNPAVESLFHRTVDTDGKGRKYGTDLSYLYTHVTQLKSEVSETEISTQSGTNHISKTLLQRQHENNGVWHPDEVKVQNLNVLMDKDEFKAGNAGSLLIIGENRIDNSSIRGFELNRYAREVSDLFRDGNYFPNFPEKVVTPEGKAKTAKYGRTSFYFGFTLTEKEIGEFLHSPADQVLAAANALNLEITPDLFIQTLKAFDSRDATSVYETLTEMFSNRKRAEGYMKLITQVLRPGSYDKFLVAHNQAFGSFYNRGREFTKLEDSLQRTDTLRNQGPDAQRMVQDPNAQVSDLYWTKNANHHLEIHFKLANQPKFILFRNEAFTEAGDRIEMEVVVFNQDTRFKAGENVLELDPQSSDPLVHKLTDQISAWEEIQFTVAYTQNERDFGAPSNLEFKVPSEAVAP